MAKPYQEAKSVLKSYLERKGYGQWVEKPPISDHFSMWGPPTDAMSTAMACLVFYILKLHAKLLFGLHVCFVQLMFLDGKKWGTYRQQMCICLWTGETYWIWSFFTQVNNKYIK